jgi:hypothetical protein
VGSTEPSTPPALCTAPLEDDFLEELSGSDELIETRA